VRDYFLSKLADQKDQIMLIKIKFLGPTNSRGSRYKATVKDGDNFQFSATVPSTYASDTSDDLAAARAVAEKIRIEMNSRSSFKYEIKAYDVEIVGSYDGDLFATMTPVYVNELYN
jgi:hypothetical protein